MEKMLYRVEIANPCGEAGPYHDDGTLGEDISALRALLCELHDSEEDTVHPSLGYDTWVDYRGREIPWYTILDGWNGVDSEGSRSAFETLDQLKDWFNAEERDLLREAGFKVALYNVPVESVLTGTKQVAFLLPHAQWIEEIELP